MIWQMILLIIGFIVLIKGADVFVDGASSLAQNLKLSKMLMHLLQKVTLKKLKKA